ncbi:hypothetical protein L1286_04170 [Pseudoalteromonas sp. SMS1]|uniref:hypothetical protein n=1 Tax=Pseudoalteromonas sp. SMS1 TaxID=2908894 RepID=UPI001F1A9564|nr:hypothetical protein [Pseudoalteromonas sp. SMS1]MCF2856651.1 hypothetical protein [Pseudoalteromonas sp. SMS1]
MALEDLLVRWYDANGKAAATVADMDKEELVIGSFKIWLLKDMAVTLSGRRHFFAFHVSETNVLSSRYFWESSSEGCWRAGTGHDDNGRFKKGRERDFGGYIFETQLHHLLEAKLNSSFVEKSQAGDLFSVVNKIGDAPTKRLVEAYLKEGIFNIYTPLVSYEKALTNVLAARLDNIDEDFVKGQIGATDLQREVESTTTPTKRKRLKQDDTFWQGLNECLTHQVVNGDYHYNLSTLGDKRVNIETYQYRGDKNVDIEVAYTQDNFQLSFKSKDLSVEDSINTCICWVKSVRIADAALTSFGNYAKFPMDLCFLPQKAMDYNGQVGLTSKNRQGLNYGASGQYTCLALYDEKYCPLIQQFKREKSFSLFTQKALLPVIKAYADTLTASFDPAKVTQLKEAITDGCDAYIVKNGQIKGSIFHRHGSTGVNRANAFKNKIERCVTLPDITSAIDQLFRLNQVDGANQGKSINHNPSSLITFIYQKVFPLLETPSLQLNDPSNTVIKKVLSKHFIGSANCLVRLGVVVALYKYTADTATQTDLGVILDAIKGSL